MTWSWGSFLLGIAIGIVAVVGAGVGIVWLSSRIKE
jgi:hypothetical protein